MRDMPYRVEAAQVFLEHIWDAEGRGKFNRYDDDTERVSLSKKEQATKDAALDVMRAYFQGEMDFGDCPMYQSREKKESRKRESTKPENSACPQATSTDDPS